MPSSFPYVVRAAFDNMIEEFEDRLAYAQFATKIDLGSAQDQVFTRDRVWLPQPMIGSSYDGFDQSSNFDGLTQMWVPAQVGFHKASPKSFSAKAMRNKMAIDMYTNEVAVKLASDVNKAIRNRVALEGSIFTKRTVAPTGSADLFLSMAQMTEVGVPSEGRVAMVGVRNTIGMLSNVSDRQTMGDLSTNAYKNGKLSARIAGFDVGVDDQPIRLAAAAGGTTTVNGANQYWEPAATTVQTDGTENNRDNRYSNLVVTATSIGSIKAGDAFTIAGVNSVHLDTLQNAAQALQNGNIPIFNKVRQGWAKATGSPIPTNFEGVRQIVSTEVAKAVAGGNTALADRQDLFHSVATANSPQQLAGYIAQIKELLTGQLHGLSLQYKSGTGRDDFNSRLSPRTQRLLGFKQGQQQPNPGGFRILQVRPK